jgi:hypothetical protein
MNTTRFALSLLTIFAGMSIAGILTGDPWLLIPGQIGVLVIGFWGLFRNGPG